MRALCLATLVTIVACSSKSATELAQEKAAKIAAEHAAIDREIPALCLKIVETNLECLRNKQAADRAAGHSNDLLSDRVRLTQAEQDRTVTLHNAILLRGPSATEMECKSWALREISDLDGTLAPQINAAGGNATPCKIAVDELRNTLNAAR